MTAFDAALIDPPRGPGALEKNRRARGSRASTLPAVISISCNADNFSPETGWCAFL